MSQLQHLDLSSLEFNSSLPENLKHLPELQYLDLTGSSFTGDLNTFFGESGTFPKIKTLVLDVNPDIGGTIPTSIATLTTLETLGLVDCGLTGPLDNFWVSATNFASIRRIRLSYNPKIGGTLSTVVGSLPTMEMLDLDTCGLTGTIPTELGNLSNLQVLVLHKWVPPSHPDRIG